MRKATVLGVLLVLAAPVFAQGFTWTPPVYWPAEKASKPQPPVSHQPLGPIPQEDPAKDILFEKMAPWVYVETHLDPEHRILWARFLNTTTKKKTGWLRVGQFLEGARIVSIDSDKAVLGYRGARQKLLFVPERPAEPKNKGHQRTPEEIAAAQRRYSEFYMKKFMLLGREYDRQRGMLATVDPHGAGTPHK